MTGPSRALATYGSLRPGEPNHGVVSRIEGTWTAATAQGWLFEITWGPAEGYDGFIPDPEGASVALDVLESEQLAKRWREIDDFEGPGYARRPITVALVDGREIEASIYVALAEVD